MKTIDITVDKDGNVKVEANGFSGTDCSDATKLIEQAIGVTTDDVKKEEYYRPSEQTVRNF